MKNEMLFPATAWILLTIICLALIIAGLNATLKRTNWDKNYIKKIMAFTIIFIVAWTGLLLALSYKGFFADFSKLPPRPVLALLLPLPLILFISFSKSGTQLLRSVPPQWIIWMQSFRIAVELLLLLAFMNDLLPVQMTFEGRNFDIVTGLLALPAGYLLARRKSYAARLAIAFNIIGILLLLNILVIAVLSMPTPFRYFMNEPANSLVAEFPFILLPGILVPLAYTLHIFSLRQLLMKQNSIQPITIKGKQALS